MKETIISAKRKKTEIYTWLVCFVIANLANLYAIIAYDGTSFWELFTSLGYVLAASLVLYVIWSAIRIVIWGIGKLIKGNKKK